MTNTASTTRVRNTYAGTVGQELSSGRTPVMSRSRDHTLPPLEGRPTWSLMT